MAMDCRNTVEPYLVSRDNRLFCQTRRTTIAARACRRLVCLLCIGCLATSAQAAWDIWPFPKKEKPEKPDKIIALWTDTVLTRSDQPPVRGFGGRLMFYRKGNEKPIRIDGTLVVYAFDESGEKANNKPDRKYVFTSDQVPAHYSESKIGHSYSVWLPWDNAGGVQKEITLIVRFEPREGEAVVGEQIRQLLPGKEPAQMAAAPAAQPLTGLGAAWALSATNPTNQTQMQPSNIPQPTSNMIQPVSYQSYVTPQPHVGGAVQAAPERRMTTTTIPIHTDLALRAAASPVPQNAAANRPRQAVSAWNAPAHANWPQNVATPMQTAPVTGTFRAMPQAASAALPAPAQATPVPAANPQPPVGCQPGQFPVPGSVSASPTRGRALLQPNPGGSPFAPGFQPGQGWSNRGQATWPNAVPATY